jgi:hypothetical protein
MHEREGVTKYRLSFRPGPAPEAADIARLNAWRRILCAQGLVGQDPARYGGLGFGNISRRLPPWDAPQPERAFIITGTQTGHIENLTPEHYTLVTECHSRENRLSAKGPVKPSSEALSHGSLYELSPEVRWILHAHSPHLWRHARALGISVTDARVPYGTPAMAEEVARVYRESGSPPSGILAMGGHEDGLVAWGGAAEEAGSLLLTTLARAYALDDTLAD